MLQVTDLIPADVPDLVPAWVVAVWLRVTVQTVYNWSNNGRLPKPLRLGPKKVVWETAAIRAAVAKWIRDSTDGTVPPKGGKASGA